MNDAQNPVLGTEPPAEEPLWRPLDSLQRRVLGVLIEKAKTTPDSYPLTINAIKTGCNQKSNRDPQMDLDPDDVHATLDELRELKAVAELQGDGRTVKFRHLAYQWLGVDKVELAVLGELLLRGQQTVGELRGRAARMEAIAGMSELKPILQSLKAKNLLVEVTPPGRGQIVTHNLYEEGAPSSSVASSVTTTSASSSNAIVLSDAPEKSSLASVQQQLAELTEHVQKLEARIDELEGR